MNAEDPPPFIAYNLEDKSETGEGVSQPKLSAQVTIGEGQNKVTYRLRGLIYWDHAHFTCRMVGKGNEVYYNDGINTGHTCIPEGPLGDIQDMYQIGEAKLTYVILSLL